MTRKFSFSHSSIAFSFHHVVIYNTVAIFLLLYHFRVIYREDLVKLKEQAQIKQQQDEDDEETSGKKVPKRRRGVKSSSSNGKKDEPPKNSLSLEFVHG